MWQGEVTHSLTMRSGAIKGNKVSSLGGAGSNVKAIPVKHFNEKQDLLLKYGAMFPNWVCSLA